MQTEFGADFKTRIADMYVFERYLSFHHLAAIYVKNVDQRGRNKMCVHTLPSILVLTQVKKFNGAKNSMERKNALKRRRNRVSFFD